jgi:putative membrane protein
MSGGEPEVADVTRRTRLAAERTWLAWWRTGIASAAAAIAVGGLVPQLVEGTQWPFVALGAGYAVVAIAVFALGAVRTHAAERALAEGGYVPLAPTWIFALSGAGVCLAVATLAVVLFVQR